MNTQNFDILGWWKAQEGTYPVLALVARDLLTIYVSTVPSEAVFSVSGHVVSKSRSSLKSETVKALMCLRNWYQTEEGLQDEDVLDIKQLISEKLFWVFVSLFFEFLILATRHQIFRVMD